MNKRVHKSVASILKVSAIALVFASHAPALAQANEEIDDQGLEIAPRAHGPLTVLGHSRLLQRITEGESAWTLGDNGEIISWRFDGDWAPAAVRKVEGASGFLWSRDRLIVSQTGGRTTHLRGDNLEVIERKSGLATWRCGNEAMFTLENDRRLCADLRGGQQSKCVALSSPAIEPIVSCSVNIAGTCLTLLSESTTSAMCVPATGTPPQLLQYPPTKDIAILTNAGIRWMLNHSGDWVESTMPSNRPLPARIPDGFTCLDTRGESTTGCGFSDPAKGMDWGRVRVPRLQEVAVDTSGIYFVFSDGWLRVQPSLERVRSVFSNLSTRQLSEHSERVWVNGQILGIEASGDVARVAVCELTNEVWRLFDIQLHNGEVTQVDNGRDACPERVDYVRSGLTYAVGKAAKHFDFATKRIWSASLEAPFEGAIQGVLQAEGRTVRHCAATSWSVHVKSEALGSIPVASEACASSIALLRWDSETGLNQGPGVLLIGANTSSLHLIDEDTLQIFSFRIPIVLSRRTEVHMDSDGSWVLFDPVNSSAIRVAPDMKSSKDEDAIVVLNRIWRHSGSGVYQDNFGTMLLVTDAGIVINNSGIGPVARRVVRDDLRPLDFRPGQLRTSIRTLLQAR